MDLDDTKIFEIFLGYKARGKLINPVVAGHGAIYPGHDFYKLRFHMFPNVTYFIEKDQGLPGQFTVYTGAYENAGKTKFKNAVGKAWLSEDFRNYMEIDLPLIRTRVFMGLFPKSVSKGA